MEGFQRPDISYKPLEVENLDPTAIGLKVLRVKELCKG